MNRTEAIDCLSRILYECDDTVRPNLEKMYHPDNSDTNYRVHVAVTHARVASDYYIENGDDEDTFIRGMSALKALDEITHSSGFDSPLFTRPDR